LKQGNRKMSEFRQDPLTKRWIIIAPERGNRPGVHFEENQRTSNFCPFCPGFEDKTPPELFVVRKSGQVNGPGWDVRAVANKFPILQIEGELDRQGEGPYSKMRGVGAHEVIIENPDHIKHIHQLSVEQIGLVLKAVKERMIDLKKDIRFRYLLLFKNDGEAAGASLEHSHFQLNAFPIIPQEVDLELGWCRKHYEVNERCLLCDISDYESQVSSRIILESLYYTSFCPFASRVPYEVMIMPKRTYHGAFYTEMDNLQLIDLAQVLQITLNKLHNAKYILEKIVSLQYNMILHIAPFFDHYPMPNGKTIELDYHWHIHIVPRITKIAGLEWGAGIFVNPIFPELAAQELRGIKV